MSDTLEDAKTIIKSVIETSHTDDGDHDRFQHYFDKKAISDNLLTGKPMKALCGKVVDRQVDLQGRTICQECQRWMDDIVGSNLPPDKRG